MPTPASTKRCTCCRYRPIKKTTSKPASMCWRTGPTACPSTTPTSTASAPSSWRNCGAAKAPTTASTRSDAETVERFALRRASADRQGRRHPALPARRDPRFYRDWYRPDLMAVIVVGDVDPAQAEKMVEAHFGGLKNPEHERPRDYAVIPERTQSEGVVVTDKEAGANVAYIRYPIMPHTDANTFGQYRHDLIESLYSAMLSQRMAELTQQANPPFIQGGSSMGQVVHGYRSFSAGA